MGFAGSDQSGELPGKFTRSADIFLYSDQGSQYQYEYLVSGHANFKAQFRFFPPRYKFTHLNTVQYEISLYARILRKYKCTYWELFSPLHCICHILNVSFLNGKNYPENDQRQNKTL